MKADSRCIADLSDEELLATVKALVARECGATADLIASLAELDRRRLYLGEGFASLYRYCTLGLHLSEYAAYARIEAARAAASYPIIIDLIADGAITLTTVRLLAPHLTAENHQAVLAAARYKSKREVELQVAALRPLPSVPSSVRELSTDTALSMPATATDSGSSGLRLATERPVVTPLAPECYKVQITITRETYETLRRVQDLMRHSVPDGDPAVIFSRALQLLLAELERRKTAHTERPHRVAPCNSGSRYVPAHVRREVWNRDDGRCAFVGTNGRCVERGFLEFHHVIPYADGGETCAENLELRCRAHNAYEAELHFGLPMAAEIGN